MNLKRRGVQERRVIALIEEQLGGGKVICPRCGTTLALFDELCAAALDHPCPGFLAIDEARTAARKQVGLA